MKKSELVIENVLMKLLKNYKRVELVDKEDNVLSCSSDRFIEDALEVVRKMEEKL